MLLATTQRAALRARGGADLRPSRRRRGGTRLAVAQCGRALAGRRAGGAAQAPLPRPEQVWLRLTVTPELSEQKDVLITRPIDGVESVPSFRWTVDLTGGDPSEPHLLDVPLLCLPPSPPTSEANAVGGPAAPRVLPRRTHMRLRRPPTHRRRHPEPGGHIGHRRGARSPRAACCRAHLGQRTTPQQSGRAARTPSGRRRALPQTRRRP